MDKPVISYVTKGPTLFRNDPPNSTYEHPNKYCLAKIDENLVMAVGANTNPKYTFLTMTVLIGKNKPQNMQNSKQ